MVWLQMTQINSKKPKEKEYLLLAKAEKSRDWASNRVAGLIGTQGTLTVLPTRLITLNLWGEIVHLYLSLPNFK